MQPLSLRTLSIHRKRQTRPSKRTAEHLSDKSFTRSKLLRAGDASLDSTIQ